MSEEKSIFKKIKEAGSHTIIYGLGSVIQTMLSFLLLPLYTRYYTTDMYGVLSLVTLCGTLAGVVFYLGASSALARSYYDYSDENERKEVVSTSLFISLLGALAQIGLGYLLSTKISLFLFHSSEYSMHLTIIFVSSAFAFINNLFYMLLRFERKSKHVIALNLISLLLLTFSIIFFLVKLKLGVMSPILGGLINQIVLFVILFYFSRKLIVLKYSKVEMRLQLKIGIQNVFTGLAYYALDWLNRYFINKYCSLSDVGIYSLGYQIAMSINILFIMPFSQIWAPMRMQYRYDRNADELYKKILTYYFIIGGVITIFVSLYAKEIITVFAGHKEYITAYKVVPFVMLGLLFYGAVSIIDNGIYFQRKFIYHTYIFWIAVLFNYLLNYIFVPKFGYLAAACIMFISYAAIVVQVYFISSKLYKVHFEGKKLGVLLISGVSVLLIGIMQNYDNIYTAILVKTTLLIFLLTIIYLFVFNKNEKEKIMFIIGGKFSNVRS